MRIVYITDPYVGQKYHALQDNRKIFMEITNLSNTNGDAWVDFKNVETKQSYSCRLEAFLARYAAMSE